MKKIISIILALAGIILALSSCTPPQRPVLPSPSHHEPPIDTRRYSLESRRYASAEELYQGLLDYDENELALIQSFEKERMEWKPREIWTTEAERVNGIFGNFRKRLLEEKTLLFPYYQDKPLPPREYVENAEITAYESDIFRKPWISYLGEVDSERLLIFTMYYDPSLIEEANEKGASWLIAELDPDEVNAQNYANRIYIWEPDYIPYDKNATVYEKTYSLGDRDVLAMVIDAQESNNITVFFVYDDILAFIPSNPETIEAVLPHLTFREIHMPTGEPLSDTPGRAWSEGGVDEE